MRKMGKAIISMVLAGAMAAMTAGCSNQPVNTNTAAASGGGTVSEDGNAGKDPRLRKDLQHREW